VLPPTLVVRGSGYLGFNNSNTLPEKI